MKTACRMQAAPAPSPYPLPPSATAAVGEVNDIISHIHVTLPNEPCQMCWDTSRRGWEEGYEGVAVTVGQRRLSVSLYFVCRLFATITAANKAGLADTLLKCSIILLSSPPPPHLRLRTTSASPTMSLKLNTKFATSHCIKNKICWNEQGQTRRKRRTLLLLPSFFSCAFYMCPGERACLEPTCWSPAPAHAPCSSPVSSVLEFAPTSLDTLLRVCSMSATVCRCVCVCLSWCGAYLWQL